MITDIKTVGIIGAGTMGQGIAQVCATSGFQVVLFDISHEALERSIKSIESNLDGLLQKGKIAADQKEKAKRNIRTVTSLKDVVGDLIVEAAIEDLKVKKEIFYELESVNDSKAILTSNTSSIPITQIGSDLRFKNRFAGLHFFNPAPVMRLVEVVKGAFTDNETIETLKNFSASLGKQAVIAQDSPGFIVNRVARHFYVESLKIIEEGVTDFKTVDTLLKSAGFKMGPFELMDLIGVDTNLAVTTSMYNAFNQEPKFRPSRIQQQKVHAGHLGRKSGKGFYDYDKGN